MSGGWVSLPVAPASLEIGNRDSQSNLDSNSSCVSEPCVWLRAPVSMRKAGEWSKMILTLTSDLHIQANSHTHMGSPTHVHLHTRKHAYTCIQHTHMKLEKERKETRDEFLSTFILWTWAQAYEADRRMASLIEGHVSKVSEEFIL